MTQKEAKIELKVLSNAEEMREVERLQALVWPGVTKVPSHLLVAVAKNSGLVIGAYRRGVMVGFAFGVSAYHQTPDGEVEPKHYSHMVGTHPEYQNIGIGFLLKKAQSQLIQRMGIKLLSWTFDPLESRNAYINIALLGCICNQYEKNIYGDMDDDLNNQLRSDRFDVEWWLKSKRVISRMQTMPKKRLSYADYEKSQSSIINQTKLLDSGIRIPFQDSLDIMTDAVKAPRLVLFEIPYSIQKIKSHDLPLAKEWREYTFIAFDLLFSAGYLVTDFVIKNDGDEKRSFYVLSKEIAVKGIRDEA